MKLHLGIAGLYTDPNQHVAVPEGALSRADECVIRRAGVIEPRPGFKVGEVFTSSGSGDLDNVLAMHPYKGSMLAVGETEGTLSTVLTDEGAIPGVGWSVATEAPGPLSWSEDHIRAVEARGNLYLSTSDAPRKLTAVGAAQTAHRMGAFAPLLLSAVSDITTDATFLLTNERVSYRLVIKSKDENGVIVYSQPSGRAIARNSTGSTRDVTLTYAWTNAKVGDFLQIYRSEKATSATPADEHFLITEIELDTTTSGGVATFEDAIPEDRLGVPLYINDDQEGPDAANVRPPVAKDLALYQGSVFFANQTDYPRVVFARGVGVDSGFGAGRVQGIGQREVTATLTNASSTVSGLSAGELLGLQVGMIVYQSDAFLSDFNEHPDPVYIVGINSGAGTASLSSTWNGSTGSYSFGFLDSIRIEIPGELATFYDARNLDIVAGGIDAGYTDPYSGTEYAAVPELRAVSLDTISEYSGSTAQHDYRRMMIEAIDPETTFQINATHGDEYAPALAGASVSVGQDVEAELHPNRIGWSKANEPEHYLLASFQDVGNSAPILRALATRDALWILKGKGDGIYRLSGFGANSGFRIDLVDSSTYLLHPNLACVLNDIVYAWTNRGLVAISDAGVQPITAMKIGSDTRALETTLDHDFELPGAFAVANPKAGEVIFGLPDAADIVSEDTDAGTRVVYVYNVRTDAITKWFSTREDVSCGAYNTASRALWFGLNNDGEPLVERLETESIVNADGEHAITITGVTGTDPDDLTIAVNPGAWVPVTGALVIAGAVHSIITSVVSLGGGLYALSVSATDVFEEGLAIGYDSFASLVAWRPKTDAPGTLKRWQEVLTHWEAWTGVYQWSALYGVGPLLDSDSADYSESGYTRSDEPRDHRALAPRSQMVQARLGFGVEISQADSRWALSGLSLVYEPISSRLHR